MQVNEGDNELTRDNQIEQEKNPEDTKTRSRQMPITTELGQAGNQNEHKCY